MRGCHLGVFPSYYEPWGYTPGTADNPPPPKHLLGPPPNLLGPPLTSLCPQLSAP